MPIIFKSEINALGITKQTFQFKLLKHYSVFNLIS